MSSPHAGRVRMRSGAGLLALRTGAPIVPIALCGAEELYRGKRMVVRILEPTSVADLLGDGWPGPATPGSREELRQARALTQALAARLAEAVSTDYPTTLDRAGKARRWRWLTRLLR